MSEKSSSGPQRLGEALAEGIRDGEFVGLGSGSTVARLLPFMVREMRERDVEAIWVPTSFQIQLIAQELNLRIAPLTTTSMVKVVDGADQVDGSLNMIKGGGGALLKEKVLLSNTSNAAIVADEKKFADKLCMNNVRVPVEVIPFARETVSQSLKRNGSTDVKIRLDQRGYPCYSENGNLLMDALFSPVENPDELERELKAIPGVVEAGIFVIRPITVYKIRPDGEFEVKSTS
jgi:ribose 5-phosphate isomerase A